MSKTSISKVKKSIQDLNSAKLKDRESANASHREFIDASIAECRAMANEIQICDDAYFSASERYAKDKSAENKKALDAAQGELAECVAAYNTIMAKINESMVAVKDSYKAIAETQSSLSGSKAEDGYSDYLDEIEAVMESIESIAKSYKIVERR